MPSDIISFLKIIKVLAITIVIGALVAAFFYYIKRRDLFGGFIGAFIVAFIGTLIGCFIIDMLFYDITVKVLEFLTKTIGVNIVAGIIGGYIALFIMNKLNKDKERTKY